MAGPYSERHIRVHRDALTTNWGFRLQGGKDFKAPLTVQRVFVGSPADAELQRGDIILSIENQDARQMLHKQAMDIVKSAGGSISFKLARSSARASSPVLTSSVPSSNTPQYIRSRPLETTTPKPTTPLGKYPSKSAMPLGGGGPHYGTDYSHGGNAQPRGYGGAPQGGNMLNRVQTSLDAAIYEPGRESGYNEDTYQPVPIHDLRKNFQQSAPQYQGAANGEEEDDYERQSVKDIKKNFAKANAKALSRPPLRYGNQSAFRKPAPRSPGSSTFSNNPLSMFQPAVLQQAARAQQNRPPGAVKPFRKPNADLPRSMLEPGWKAQPKNAKDYSSVIPPNRQPVNRPANRPVRPPQQEIRHFDEGPPAWSGSLRSSRGSRPWELQAQDNLVPGQQHQPVRQRPAPGPAPMAQGEHAPAVVTPHQPRVQMQNYGPGGQPSSIGQANASSHDGDAKVAHLQYNTPIGLYSKQNVQETLSAQTGGKAGDGTMLVTGGAGPKGDYNPATSSVYRMIAEEEGRKAKPRGYARGEQQQPQQQQQQQQPIDDGQSARYQEHAPQQEMQYRGYQDHSRQSRSMHALEDFVANEGEGTSDF